MPDFFRRVPKMCVSGNDETDKNIIEGFTGFTESPNYANRAAHCALKLLREESVLQEKLAEQEGAGKLASTGWYHADLTEQPCLPLPWSILERQSTHYCLFPLCSPVSFTLEKGKPLLCWIPHRNWAGGQS